jgi:hypothetical protein
MYQWKTRANVRDIGVERDLRRSKSRIQSIDINTDINWVLQSNTILDFLDDSLGTNGINLSGLNNLETAVSVVLIITGTTQCCADTSVDVAMISEKSFLRCVPEVSSVVDCCLLAG